MLNKIDCNIEPWGTSMMISSHSHREERVFTHFFFFNDKFWIDFKLPSFSPYAAKLVTMSSWFTQSYLLERSINKVPKILSVLSKIFFHFWSKFASAYWVLCPFLELYEKAERNLFENFVSWSNNIVSNILDIFGSIVAGL